MRSLALLERPAEAVTAAPEDLLRIDAHDFHDRFDCAPFLIGHRLVDHPLFELPRLLELARTLPDKHVEYNAGNVPVTLNPELTPRTGLSVDETIRRIAECKSWMVLKYVETDPEYGDLLRRCLAEVKTHSEPLRPGMMQAESFIFLTSPGSVTPYHMDPEHNFLLQVRGRKRVHLYDWRQVLTQKELENFHGGAHRNLEFREELRERGWKFDLTPGQGLHFPVTFPHWVENGPEVSVSFSITFRTPDLEKRASLHLVNGFLRRRGWHPSSVDARPWRDTMKYQAYRVWRKASRLLRRPTP